MQEDGRKKTTALTFVYNKCDRAARAVLANLFFCFDLHFTSLCSGLLQKDLFLKEGEVWLNFFSNIILLSNLSHRLAVFFPLLSYQVDFANKQKDALDLALFWMI